MMKKNYIINYICYSTSGLVLHEGKMRVRNRVSDFDAKCSLEDFLKRKYENFGKLVVLSCVVDVGLNELFDGIFGSNNPFKF